MIAITCVALAAFLAGIGAILVFHHRHSLLALTHDAYLARFAAMTSARSAPRRYYVVHEDSDVLKDFATQEPAVLTVSTTQFNRLSAIDIQHGSENIIEVLQQLDGIHYTFKGNIPLFCH